MDRAARAVIVVGLLVAGLVLFVMLFEEKLIYFPLSKLDMSPDQLGLRYENVSLVAEDGVRLHAWFLPHESPSFTVLLFHGNAGNISHRLDRALLMQSKLRTSVLLFDYRGYGQSEGSPDEQGTYRDGRAALRYLTGELKIPEDRIILFGESLGAAVAIQLALESEVRALALESAFTSIPDVGSVHYPFLPVAILLRTRYDNLEKMPDVEVPVLLLHGVRDRIVPFEHGRRLYEAAKEPKSFFPIEGAGHNDTFFVGGNEYWNAWKEFLESLNVAANERD
jgi:fermentation-respiration switch protein FrsA (DUF1100 family)